MRKLKLEIPQELEEIANIALENDLVIKVISKLPILPDGRTRNVYLVDNHGEITKYSMRHRLNNGSINNMREELREHSKPYTGYFLERNIKLVEY